MEEWEKDWPKNPKGTVAKIIYNRSAGEVRVVGLHNGEPFQKDFQVDTSLTLTLKLASEFVKQVADAR